MRPIWAVSRAVLYLTFFCSLLGAEASLEPQSKPKFPDLKKWVKKAQFKQGFFNLYQEDQNLYLALPHSRLKEEFFLFSSLSAGLYGGLLLPSMPLNQDRVYFEKQGDRIRLNRRDSTRRANQGSPEEKSLRKTQLDSLIHGFKILAADKKKKIYLISLNSWLWKAGGKIIPQWILNFFSLSGTDLSQTWWIRIQTFPDNLELEFQTTLKGQGASLGSDTSNQSRLVFSLVRKSDSQYKPRAADDRVGYFTRDQIDFSNPLKDDGVQRVIKRWNLEKAEPKLKLSVVKKPIVFHLMDDIPTRFRAVIRSGVLEWNKAFEALGLLGALEVRLPDEGSPVEPSDLRVSTISWTANPAGFALGPHRSHPETGEILDADIVVSSGVETWFVNRARIFDSTSAQISPNSWLLDQLLAKGAAKAPLAVLESFRQKMEIQKRWIRHGVYACQNLNSARIAQALATLGAGNQESGDENSKQIEWLDLSLKNLVMHEVGHALGLRHNFIASAMVKTTDLKDPHWNQSHQPSTSVMDYPDINLTENLEHRGKILNDSLGEYDYKAIAYGYQPILDEKQEEQTLTSLAQSLRTSGLEYATDEGLYLGYDPRVQAEDQGDDPVLSALERLGVVRKIFQSVEAQVLTTGGRYFRLRDAVFTLIQDVLQKTWYLTQVIGGIKTRRDHAGDPGGLLPFTPVSRRQQENALDFFQDQIFSENLFGIPTELLSRLGINAYHWESRSPLPLERILSFFRILVIWGSLSHRSFQFLANYHQILGQQSMTLDSLFERMHSMVFIDLQGKTWASEVSLSAVDMESQRFYVRYLGYLKARSATYPGHVASLISHNLQILKVRLLALLGSGPQSGFIPFKLRLKTQRSFENTEVRAHFNDLLASINQIESMRIVQQK